MQFFRLSLHKKKFFDLKKLLKTFFGGGGGIRTHEAISDLPVFKTGAFNQALPPLQKYYFKRIYSEKKIIWA